MGSPKPRPPILYCAPASPAAVMPWAALHPPSSGILAAVVYPYLHRGQQHTKTPEAACRTQLNAASSAYKADGCMRNAGSVQLLSHLQDVGWTQLGAGTRQGAGALTSRPCPSQPWQCHLPGLRSCMTACAPWGHVLWACQRSTPSASGRRPAKQCRQQLHMSKGAGRWDAAEEGLEMRCCRLRQRSRMSHLMFTS